jgi:hypothetical protein
VTGFGWIAEAFVSRDLGWRAKALDAARATLEEHGDHHRSASLGERVSDSTPCL